MEIWRRQRMLRPQPPWRPCRPALLHPPPAPPPPCLVILGTSPAGRGCKSFVITDSQITQYLHQLMGSARQPEVVSDGPEVRNWTAVLVRVLAEPLQRSTFVLACRGTQLLLVLKAGNLLSFYPVFLHDYYVYFIC